MPKVSVIIPLYNASSYIPDLKQLWEQTLQDFELILVDDCSTDDTWDKLQEFKAQNSDKAIILARNEHNLGPGGTRNHGLTKSSGEYVIFLDGDDRYEPMLLEKMSKRLDDTHADLVCCGFQEQYGERTDTKLFSAELLAFLSAHNISFPDITLGEDRCWGMLLTLRAHHIEIINEPLYHYIIRQNSITNNFNKNYVIELIKSYDFSFNLLVLKEQCLKIHDAWLYHFWDTLFSQYQRLSSTPDIQRILLTQAQAFCQEHQIPCTPESIPLLGRLGLYKVLPKGHSFLPLRTKLKEQYRVARLIKRFNELL